MDRGFFERHRPWPSTPWAVAITALTRHVFRRRGVEVVIDGRERLGRTPAVIACNATHQYDLIPIRYAFRAAGHDVVTLSKGKNYHGRAMRLFCVKLGSVPLASRGYVIVMDFLAVHGRRPDEAEYRALRAHVDGAAAPRGEVYDVLATRRRRMLGYPFDPGRGSYREAMQHVYADMMRHTVALARRAMARGHDLQIFPQGSSATRLSEGRVGAVQLAHALDVPIVPVGVSGCLTVLPAHRRLQLAPGRVTLRVGEPYRADLCGLPETFQPFVPEQERRCAPVLRAATDDLMERINALLNSEYQWAADRRSDGAAGVQRFA